MKAAVALLSCVTFFGSLAFAIAANRNFREERLQYSDQTRKTYNFRFGQDAPFFPSNAQTEGREFIQPGAFPDAKYCGHCHAGAYDQWRQSLHSNSFREPFYKKNVDLLSSTKKGLNSPVTAKLVTTPSRLYPEQSLKTPM